MPCAVSCSLLCSVASEAKGDAAAEEGEAAPEEMELIADASASAYKTQKRAEEGNKSHCKRNKYQHQLRGIKRQCNACATAAAPPTDGCSAAVFLFLLLLRFLFLCHLFLLFNVCVCFGVSFHHPLMPLARDPFLVFVGFELSDRQANGVLRATHAAVVGSVQVRAGTAPSVVTQRLIIVHCQHRPIHT